MVLRMSAHHLIGPAFELVLIGVAVHSVSDVLCP
jgi:hypothetical protein